MLFWTTKRYSILIKNIFPFKSEFLRQHKFVKYCTSALAYEYERHYVVGGSTVTSNTLTLATM